VKKIVVAIISLFTLFSILLVGLFINSNQNENESIKEQATEKAIKKDVREVVWDQLTSEQKGQIKGTWKDGIVSKITMNEDAVLSIEGELVTGQFIGGKEVYMIDFPTKSLSVPNNMLVVADIDTFDLIGLAPVD